MFVVDPAFIRDRYIEHFTYAMDFAERFNKEHGCDVAVDADALYVAVTSAYDDIERYKQYHLEKPITQKSNCVKRAAYLVKWINRFKPLRVRQITTDSGASPNLLPFLANIYYSFTIARSHLETESKKSFHFTNGQIHKMAYDLSFREVGGDSLLALFQDYFDLLSERKLFDIFEQQHQDLIEGSKTGI